MTVLSVIIPVYNVEKYLAKCLDSITHQTFKDMEIICVDDCSTDNSLSLLQNYALKDKRIRIIRCQKNGGQAAARQIGIDAAAGNYIAFVDSDDWVDTDYYEKMIERAEQDKVDIVVNHNILSEYEDGRVIPYCFPGHKYLEQRIYDNPSKIIDKFYCVVWNKLFRASFLKQRQYTIPQRSPHEDVFFHYATFAFARNVSFFNGSAYHYLYREQSISHLNHDWGMEHIKVFSLIYDFYKENQLLDKKIKLYSTMPFFTIKTEDMFNEYKKYFMKVLDYITENSDVFCAADIFIAKCLSDCKNYSEYASKYPANLTMIFLRRKK